MPRNSNRFFVLTGGPGSGKTTMIERLAAAGHTTSVEAGRSIIRDQAAISGTALPWHDRALFAELMLSWEMRSHTIAEATPGPAFFDRGVPDVIGYLRLVGLPVPIHIEQAAREFRYNRKVFVLPHWPEIFTQDNERRQDEDEARRTHASMVATYAACGYDLVEVPTAPVEDRLAFILENVRQA
ncbi:AAA family ATPase [Aminobacter aminovorans]|uniref:ATPase n=1 Tax=Aminobacter aminovorans TaxID=83263 RepID=A0AAC9FDQ9_AMIAI|nr:AAA family ATPase [Aminobacter aminovorans]AMS41775.1 ATPase [Aminobacter aminovorans]MBB3703877.1 putative ATPase [Aminobacter aminovorans]WMC95153.1 AAA family ATPase [Aminobacter aminovorans]